MDKLPQNLICLEFSWYFNKSVDKLPDSITHLKFGDMFNQPVDHLPKELTHLELGTCFNQPVDNLPNKLTHIIFNDDFNKRVDNLPKSIIEIGFWSGCKIRDYLPNKIEQIKIFFYDYDKQNETIYNLPSNIKKIIVNSALNIHRLKKIPFDCKVYDEEENEIFL